MNEFHIKITDRPASKKNSRIPIYRNGRMYFIPSSAYTKFKRSALKQLKNYHLLPNFPLLHIEEIQYTFFQKGGYQQDHDNAEASINDILQEAGIIIDDKIIKKWSGKIIPHSLEWITEILIYY